MDDKIKYYPPGMPAQMAMSNKWIHMVNVAFRRPHDPVLYKDYVLVLKNRFGKSGLRDIEDFLFEIGVLKGSFTRK